MEHQTDDDASANARLFDTPLPMPMGTVQPIQGDALLITNQTPSGDVEIEDEVVLAVYSDDQYQPETLVAVASASAYNITMIGTASTTTSACVPLLRGANCLISQAVNVNNFQGTTSASTISINRGAAFAKKLTLSLPAPGSWQPFDYTVTADGLLTLLISTPQDGQIAYFYVNDSASGALLGIASVHNRSGDIDYTSQASCTTPVLAGQQIQFGYWQYNGTPVTISASIANLASGLSFGAPQRNLGANITFPASQSAGFAVVTIGAPTPAGSYYGGIATGTVVSAAGSVFASATATALMWNELAYVWIAGSTLLLPVNLGDSWSFSVAQNFSDNTALASASGAWVPLLSKR